MIFHLNESFYYQHNFFFFVQHEKIRMRDISLPKTILNEKKE